jgi:hypothetical protein
MFLGLANRSVMADPDVIRLAKVAKRLLVMQHKPRADSKLGKNRRAKTRSPAKRKPMKKS